MSKLLEKVSHAHTVLTNNDNIFLPTESSYLLANQNRHRLQQRSRLYPQPVFLFDSLSKITQYTTALSWQAQLLLELLPPGNVEFILPHNTDLLNSHQFNVFIPNHPQTLDLLSRCDQPLASIYPQIGLNALLVHHKYISGHPEYNDTFTLVSEQALSGILPTLVDLTDPDQVVIRRPGAIGLEEIANILQGQIPVVKDYLLINSFRDDWLKISMVESLPEESDNGINLVFGSKEILSQMFSIPLAEYFHHKKIGNFVLKNIGSRTSQETVARNLSKNALDLYKLGIQNVYIMEEDWGRSKWSEVINYYLEGIAVSLVKQQVGGIKIPVRVRPVVTRQDFVLS